MHRRLGCLGIPSRRLAAGAATAVLAVSLAACGSSSSSSSAAPSSSSATASSSASASTSASTSASASGGSSAPVSLAFENILSSVKFFQDISTGIRAAAVDAGNTSVTINAPTTINPVLAQTQVTNAVAQSPNGIGIDPYTPDVWQHSLQLAAQQVPKILVYNDKPVVLPGQVGAAHVHTYVGISDSAFAHDTAVATIKAGHLSASTSGVVLLGQCVPGTAGVLAERNAAYLTVIHQMLPKTKVIQFDSQVVPTANTAAWSSELQAHPNPVLALGGCDQDGSSLDILKKKTGQHFVAAGIDVTPQALTGVADGTLADTMTDNFYLQGYVSAALLAKAARGTPLPTGWVDTGYTLITKKNVDAMSKANLTDGPATVAFWKAKAQAIVNNVSAYTKPLAEAWVP